MKRFINFVGFCALGSAAGFAFNSGNKGGFIAIVIAIIAFLIEGCLED